MTSRPDAANVLFNHLSAVAGKIGDCEAREHPETCTDAAAPFSARQVRHAMPCRHPQAAELLIMADGGGSNGSRCRLWKVALQALADQLQMPIRVCHFPPGTSKWNKIEHRMFCHITQNWRGRPLISHEVIVNLIANTATRQGLKIRAELDQHRYPTGTKVSDAELQRVKLKPHKFHGDWNYTITPTQTKK